MQQARLSPRGAQRRFRRNNDSGLTTAALLDDFASISIAVWFNIQQNDSPPRRTLVMDSLLAIILGGCLAASCGFRVFAPMLIMSIAALAGRLTLAEGWHWIGSWPAVILFAVATVTEIGGYYVPWINNVLDTMASPAAVVAGIVATAACISDMDPLLKWSLALLGGGGIAGLIQTATVIVRGASTATTGGVGNPIVATIEAIVSFLLPILAIVVPILAFVMLCGFCGVGFVVVRWIRRRLFRQTLAVVVAEDISGSSD